MRWSLQMTLRPIIDGNFREVWVMAACFCIGERCLARYLKTLDPGWFQLLAYSAADEACAA
jgi:hypothetical protein